MKLWQYVVGIWLAILIFSGAVYSEYFKYQKISFLENTPFSLVGEFDYPEKGYKEFISENGETMRIFNESEAEISADSRKLINGRIFLSGSFFNDSNKSINNIKLGNLRLEYPGSNVIISRNSTSNTTEILNYGRTSNLYLFEQEQPFIIPSKTRIVIKNDLENFLKSPHNYFYEYSQKFELSSIDWSTELADSLSDGMQAVYNFRNSFKRFATNIPSIWGKDRLDAFRSFIFGLVGKKESNQRIETLLSKVLEIKNLIDEVKEGESISQSFPKVAIMEAFSMLSSPETLEAASANKQWELFEKSQKIWLPVINDKQTEWLYSDLWKNKKHNMEKLSDIIDNAELFIFNLAIDASDDQLLKLGEEIKKINAERVSEFEISSLRRRMFYLLISEINSGEHIDSQIIDTYLSIEKLELDIYKETDIFDEISKEKVMQIIDLVNNHIYSEEETSRKISQKFIEFLLVNFDLDAFIRNHLSNDKETHSKIINIKLIGTSGLTLDEIKTINSVKQSEAELNKLIDRENEKEEETIDNNLISNSKTLWEFLKSKNINIDIKTFRTNRTETELETVFENTEIEKRKISGRFDYNGQIFKQLRLGTATIQNLEPHTLSTWIKQIAGKFEPIEAIEEPVKKDPLAINQNSREALVNKQFLKDYLNSLNFSVSKANIKIVTKDLKNLTATNVRFLDNDVVTNNISLSFNIETKEFYRVFTESEKSKIYLSESSIRGKTLQEKSREFFKKEEKSD